MSLKAVLFVIPLIACPMAAAASPQADPFCRQLQAVVEDVPQDFAAFRGGQLQQVPDDGGGDGAIRFAATRSLPGASACGVDALRSDGDAIPSLYLCWFAPGRSGPAALLRIAHQIGDCLGREKIDHGPVVLAGDRAAFDIQRTGFVLSVTSVGDRPVVLAISGK